MRKKSDQVSGAAGSQASAAPSAAGSHRTPNKRTAATTAKAPRQKSAPATKSATKSTPKKKGDRFANPGSDIDDDDIDDTPTKKLRLKSEGLDQSAAQFKVEDGKDIVDLERNEYDSLNSTWNAPSSFLRSMLTIHRSLYD